MILALHVLLFPVVGGMKMMVLSKMVLCKMVVLSKILLHRCRAHVRTLCLLAFYYSVAGHFQSLQRHGALHVSR
jgi:hypothetical protein